MHAHFQHISFLKVFLVWCHCPKQNNLSINEPAGIDDQRPENWQETYKPSVGRLSLPGILVSP